MRRVFTVFIVLLCLACSGSIESAAVQGTNKQERIIAQTDNEARNVQTIKNIYAGYGNGNMDPLYKSLATSYTWRTQSAANFGSIVSDFDNDAAGYFAAIPYVVEKLTVETITSNSNQVVAIIKMKFKNPTVGKGDDTRMSALWTFNYAGKITGFLEFRDTAALLDVLTSGQTQYSLTRFATEETMKFNSRDPELAYSDYHPNAKISINNADIISVADAKKDFADTIASFPDMHYEILSITAGGDRVVSQLKITGTFTGKPYMGYPPNGKFLTLYSTSIETVLNGKIVEEHEYYDTAAVASILDGKIVDEHED